ncbi:hypothetical protein P3S68_002424 [Capsicum galapagoense]
MFLNGGLRVGEDVSYDIDDKGLYFGPISGHELADKEITSTRETLSRYFNRMRDKNMV